MNYTKTDGGEGDSYGGDELTLSQVTSFSFDIYRF